MDGCLFRGVPEFVLTCLPSITFILNALDLLTPSYYYMIVLRLHLWGM